MAPKPPITAIIMAVEEETVGHQEVHPQDKVTTTGVMEANQNQQVIANIKIPPNRPYGTAISTDTIKKTA
jgi:hypothetical protein